MKITKRQKQIIKILLEKAGETTCEKIGKLIGVSDRTVSNEIKRINRLLDEKNQILIFRGKGIKLIGNDINFKLHKMCDYLEENNLDIKLIEKLLINNYFNQKVFSIDIAEEMFVSLGSFKKIVEKAKVILREYQLNIISSNKNGIYIEGDESDVRLCMSNILFSNTIDYVSFLQNLGMFNKKEIDEIKKLVLSILEKSNISLTYIAFNSFIIHILISILRYNYKIDYSIEDIKILNKTNEKKVVENIIVKLKDEINYDVSDDLYYLTEHLVTSQKFSNKDSDITIDELTNYIFSRIVDRLKTDFLIDFSEDEIFSQSLKIHLLTSINRYRISVPIKHINLSEIKSQYPIVYDMGIVASKEIEKVIQRKIDNTEILFLALHIGTAFNRLDKSHKKGSEVLIICGAGLSTARFLKYSLLDNFNEQISHIDIISYNEYTPEIIRNYDLVLSSLNNFVSIDGVINVNYILTKTELDILKNKLLSLSNEEHLKVFEEDLFFIKSYDNKDQILEFITNKLKSYKLLDDNQIKSIYEREKMGNTSLGNKIAIPHPLSYSSKEMKIAVLINRKDVLWGNDYVKIVLLLLIPKDKISQWDKMFKKLYRIFNVSDNVKKLYKSNSFIEFIDVLIEEME